MRTENRATIFGSCLTATIAATTLGGWSGHADAETSGSIEIRRLTVDGDARLEDVRGVGIGLEYRVGSVEVDKALFLVARVSVGGRKVGSLVSNVAYRDGNDGSLHSKKQLVTVPRRAWRQTSLFVPFYAMKLAAGPHELGVDLEAVSDPGQCKTGERPEIVRIVGERSAAVSITKPPYELVQILVRRVDVAEEAADSSIWPWRTRPDLAWRARLQAGAGGVLFTSEVRDDTYSASWSQYSPEFPLSQGDRLTLSVIDRDVMGHDTLGSVKLTLDDVLGRGEGATSLSAGKVSSIVLGRVKVR
jgi:hypothetical protein